MIDTLTFTPRPDAKITGLAVFSEDNQPSLEAGIPMARGACLVRLPYAGEGYTCALDQWRAAEAAAEVLGGGFVGLAALVDGVWVNVDHARLLGCD